ncbi:MAG: CHRD domain-containing protein, partial [Pyrinomonadaceae bacterium]|nr:CHRD domain-containing protein [Pyrinomonadaceae bacterium]
MNNYKKVICVMAFAFILLGISPAAFADTIFVATLQGSQESTPNNSPATGVGSVILNAAETQVTIKVQFA